MPQALQAKKAREVHARAVLCKRHFQLMDYVLNFSQHEHLKNGTKHIK